VRDARPEAIAGLLLHMKRIVVFNSGGCTIIHKNNWLCDFDAALKRQK
jgi:hypothetical protein